MELFTSQLNFYKRATQNFAVIKIEAALVITGSGMIMAKLFLMRCQNNQDPDTSNLDKATVLLQQLKKKINEKGIN